MDQHVASSHKHGTADEDQEVEPVLVGEQGVPDPDDVRQEEFLGQQQGQPAERKVLRLDVLLLLLRPTKPLREVSKPVEWWVTVFPHRCSGTNLRWSWGSLSFNMA